MFLYLFIKDNIIFAIAIFSETFAFVRKNLMRLDKNIIIEVRQSPKCSVAVLRKFWTPKIYLNFAETLGKTLGKLPSLPWTISLPQKILFANCIYYALQYYHLLPNFEITIFEEILKNFAQFLIDSIFRAEIFAKLSCEILTKPSVPQQYQCETFDSCFRIYFAYNYNDKKINNNILKWFRGLLIRTVYTMFVRVCGYVHKHMCKLMQCICSASACVCVFVCACVCVCSYVCACLVCNDQKLE